ncbi:hypothetical protein [Peribacillus sp. SCS-155]|uniref:hypothetical protein n=1 Tax=Peribacillus sedimenti TaxID=3115297 RepID=UPI003906C525
MIIHSQLLKLLRAKGIPLSDSFIYPFDAKYLRKSIGEIFDRYGIKYGEGTLELVKMYQDWTKEEVLDSIHNLGFRQCLADIVGEYNGDKMERIVHDMVSQGQVSVRFLDDEGKLQTWLLEYDAEEGIKLTKSASAITTDDLTQVMKELTLIIDDVIGYDGQIMKNRNHYWASFYG